MNLHTHKRRRGRNPKRGSGLERRPISPQNAPWPWQRAGCHWLSARIPQTVSTLPQTEQISLFRPLITRSNSRFERRNQRMGKGKNELHRDHGAHPSHPSRAPAIMAPAYYFYFHPNAPCIGSRSAGPGNQDRGGKQGHLFGKVAFPTFHGCAEHDIFPIAWEVMGLGSTTSNRRVSTKKFRGGYSEEYHEQKQTTNRPIHVLHCTTPLPYRHKHLPTSIRRRLLLTAVVPHSAWAYEAECGESSNLIPND